MNRIVSGIKPTGEAHIGNYLGAMRLWPSFQSDENQVLYFVADLHSLNTRQDPSELQRRTLDLVAWLITVGVDPKRSIIMVQSMVSAHSELCWILNNYVTMGELSRMTQFKDKAKKGSSDGQLVGLYTYPILMAADILLYDANEVPVGNDQAQHVELTRVIAERLNNLYGELFTIPKAVHTPNATRIMSLQDPVKKMSKSESDSSFVLLLDTKDSIIDKFKRAVTDSDNKICYDKAKKPAITNLLEIFAGFSDYKIEDIEKKYANKGYAEFKLDLGILVADKLGVLQESFKSIRADESKLIHIIEKGNAQASNIARKKLKEVKEKIGLL